MVNITVLRDGSELEEASASDLLYEVGSRSFIPGLDELLGGAEAGTIAEGQGTLPPGFTDHGGEEVTLRVLVKEVRGKKLPELTDELVADVSEFETVAEAREQIERNLLVFKIREARASSRTGSSPSCSAISTWSCRPAWWMPKSRPGFATC